MSAAARYHYNTLQAYEPPPWAKALRHQPAAYVELAQRPTPIHAWPLPAVPPGFQVWVKRDDMTGSTLSGNKIRKLEFLLADAMQQGCDSVVTCGGIQSNHSRATAVAARQLGLKPHLLLRWSGKIDVAAVGCNGNLLLDRFSAAKILLVPPINYDGSVVYGKEMKGLKQKMEDYGEKLKAEGSTPYLIPVGGSNSVGTWGYIEAFREMMEQGVLENFDDIVLATGSGGTLGGIVIGNYLTGSKVKIHGVCVCDDAAYFYNHIDVQLREYSLTQDSEGKPLRAKDITDIIDGYKGRGYGISTDEELAQLTDIFTKTGISVDPVYNLKAIRGMLSELQGNPGRFAGKRILYIHTGGIYGLYDGRVDKMLKENPETNQVYSYNDVIPS